MIGYKAAYDGKIEFGFNIKEIRGNGVILPESIFDVSLRRGFSLSANFETLLESYCIGNMMFISAEPEGASEVLSDNTILTEGLKNIKFIDKSDLTNYIAMNAEELFASENPLIRKAVVAAGYKIDEAVSDKAATVRVEVAKQGRHLDILENDAAPAVLYAVVKQNHNLEKFLRHEDYDVRMEATRRYKSLNTKEA